MFRFTTAADNERSQDNYPDGEPYFDDDRTHRWTIRRDIYKALAQQLAYHSMSEDEKSTMVHLAFELQKRLGEKELVYHHIVCTASRLQLQSSGFKRLSIRYVDLHYDIFLKHVVCAIRLASLIFPQPEHFLEAAGQITVTKLGIRLQHDFTMHYQEPPKPLQQYGTEDFQFEVMHAVRTYTEPFGSKTPVDGQLFITTPRKNPIEQTPGPKPPESIPSHDTSEKTSTQIADTKQRSESQSQIATNNLQQEVQNQLTGLNAPSTTQKLDEQLQQPESNVQQPTNVVTVNSDPNREPNPQTNSADLLQQSGGQVSQTPVGVVSLVHNVQPTQHQESEESKVPFTRNQDENSSYQNKVVNSNLNNVLQEQTLTQRFNYIPYVPQAPDEALALKQFVEQAIDREKRWSAKLKQPQHQKITQLQTNLTLEEDQDPQKKQKQPVEVKEVESEHDMLEGFDGQCPIKYGQDVDAAMGANTGTGGTAAMFQDLFQGPDAHATILSSMEKFNNLSSAEQSSVLDELQGYLSLVHEVMGLQGRERKVAEKAALKSLTEIADKLSGRILVETSWAPSSLAELFKFPSQSELEALKEGKQSITSLGTLLKYEPDDELDKNVRKHIIIPDGGYSVIDFLRAAGVRANFLVNKVKKVSSKNLQDLLSLCAGVIEHNNKSWTFEMFYQLHTRLTLEVKHLEYARKIADQKSTELAHTNIIETQTKIIESHEKTHDNQKLIIKQLQEQLDMAQSNARVDKQTGGAQSDQLKESEFDDVPLGSKIENQNPTTPKSQIEIADSNHRPKSPPKVKTYALRSLNQKKEQVQTQAPVLGKRLHKNRTEAKKEDVNADDDNAEDLQFETNEIHNQLLAKVQREGHTRFKPAYDKIALKTYNQFMSSFTSLKQGAVSGKNDFRKFVYGFLMMQLEKRTEAQYMCPACYCMIFEDPTVKIAKTMNCKDALTSYEHLIGSTKHLSDKNMHKQVRQELYSVLCVVLESALRDPVTNQRCKGISFTQKSMNSWRNMFIPGLEAAIKSKSVTQASADTHQMVYWLTTKTNQPDGQNFWSMWLKVWGLDGTVLSQSTDQFGQTGKQMNHHLFLLALYTDSNRKDVLNMQKEEEEAELERKKLKRRK